MENIFENAKFGDKFQTRDGRMAIYHYSRTEGEVLYHYLMIEPREINDEICGRFLSATYKPYINDNGIGRLANLIHYKNSGASACLDIIKRYEQ